MEKINNKLYKCLNENQEYKKLLYLKNKYETQIADLQSKLAIVETNISSLTTDFPSLLDSQ